MARDRSLSHSVCAPYESDRYDARWRRHHPATTPYDAGGRWAKKGTADLGLLGAFMGHAFFDRPPPKSTGREEFNLAWVDEVVAAAGSGPLVLSSQRVENLDAYAELRHQRPIAFVFPNELDRARDFVPAFGGADVRLVVVDHREQPVEMDVSGMVAQTTHGALRARTWVLPGATSSEDPCTWDYTPRGFCLQRDWLSGGLPQMQAGAATRRERRPGLLRY